MSSALANPEADLAMDVQAGTERDHLASETRLAVPIGRRSIAVPTMPFLVCGIMPKSDTQNRTIASLTSAQRPGRAPFALPCLNATFMTIDCRGAWRSQAFSNMAIDSTCDVCGNMLTAPTAVRRYAA